MAVFDATSGKLLRTWGAGLVKPHSLRLNIQDASKPPDVWIADMNKYVVQMYTPQGMLVKTLGQPGISGTGLNPLQFGHGG